MWWDWKARVERKIDDVLLILGNLRKQGGKMSAGLDALTAAVTEMQGVEASAKAAIEGLAAKLTDLLNSGATTAQLQAFADTIHATAQDLSGAIAANPIPQ